MVSASESPGEGELGREGEIADRGERRVEEELGRWDPEAKGAIGERLIPEEECDDAVEAC